MVGVAELFNYVSGAVARDARDRFKSEQNPWVNGTWTDEIYLSSPKRGPKVKTSTSLSFSRLWDELGPDRAMAELERQLNERDESWLRSVLGFLHTKRDPVTIPLLIRCLAHRSLRFAAAPRYSSANLAGKLSRLPAATWLARPTAQRHTSDRFSPGRAQGNRGKPRRCRLARTPRQRPKGREIQAARPSALLDHKRLSVDLERVRDLFRQTHSKYRIEKLLGPGMFTAAYLATHVISPGRHGPSSAYSGPSS